jgi:small subunit ribosomal protein S17
MPETPKKSIMTRRTMHGTVVRRSDPHTIVVEIVTEKRHPKYHKRYQTSKRYLVHTAPDVKVEVGASVEIVETRPISRNKRWKVLS